MYAHSGGFRHRIVCTRSCILLLMRKRCLLKSIEDDKKLYCGQFYQEKNFIIEIRATLADGTAKSLATEGAHIMENVLMHLNLILKVNIMIYELILDSHFKWPHKCSSLYRLMGFNGVFNRNAFQITYNSISL